ncbi:unnamed protein product [Darwinula stevensoni]|uniref:Beta-hexosaminidase n=1 Tax=Darwinula stevensoni TaxID=69355 RepID=A0A7R9AE93_9CRUS|nr:unnamed protein product [Darwinula stevensoni]CAG0901695.1 unnamed protein product [Darwinula stevensoni]
MHTLAIFFLVLPLCQGELFPVAARFILPGYRYPPGSPWPHPRVWGNTSELVTLNPSNFLLTSNTDCDVITGAIDRYRPLIFIDPDAVVSSDLVAIPSLTIQVLTDEHCTLFPQLDSDPDYEAYTLDIPSSGGAKVEAKTIWGALRGLETFSQLVWTLKDDNGNSFAVANVTKIEDKPRFPHRGILLDTARHFLTVETLKRNLDAMAYNKFNVFHWHLTDDQAFPYQSQVFPLLSEKGAYTQRHLFRQDDVREVMEYARLRGIRVIPEIDSPGHTHAMRKGHPELLTACYGDGVNPGTPDYPNHADREVLDPSKNSTYEFMKTLFQELKDLFQDKFLHLGMDEVKHACWESSPEIQNFMTENGIQDYSQLEQYYINRHVAMIQGLGSRYISYQDPIELGLDLGDALVQVWKDGELGGEFSSWQDYMMMVTGKGYQVIFSSCWYLNYISYGEDWRRYYECDPTNFPGTEEERSLVVGGEAAVWGEFVDGVNLEARLWPRASAVAERLWSDPVDVLGNTDDALFRIHQHRCRMLRFTSWFFWSFWFDEREVTNSNFAGEE